MRALLLGEAHPRQEVRVMLHLGDDDFVARLDECLAPAAGDEVNGFGRAAREDDFGGSRALRNCATRARAASYSSDAFAPTPCPPRCTFAL